MPCYSTITQTQIAVLDRLERALNDLGVKVISKSVLRVETAVGTFFRSTEGSSFSFDGDTKQLGHIGRKYAELGVRAWAQRAGFSVTDKTDNRITLQRRG